MRRLDRRDAIRFIDVTEGQACPLDPATLLERFHARERGQPLVSGAAAFAAMWRAIPLLRPLGLAARWNPFLALLERLYRGFLKIRPKLQQLAGGSQGPSQAAMGSGSGPSSRATQHSSYTEQ